MLLTVHIAKKHPATTFSDYNVHINTTPIIIVHIRGENRNKIECYLEGTHSTADKREGERWSNYLEDGVLEKVARIPLLRSNSGGCSGRKKCKCTCARERERVAI